MNAKKENKEMLTVKNLIKNTPFKLHHKHQCRGVLATPSNILHGDFCKNSQGQSVTAFAKNSMSEVWAGS